ncbi:MAG: ABC transporter ATP-binding protein [Deltaproteobacteria bacterium]|nr:ABC transporter ATP-binding protein [Deltaproteobacteria bacterium]
MIELVDIKKVFNAGKPNELTAVDGVNLGIEARQITVLKGPSGSGKTTLLSLVGCMARPTAGRIILQGREITSLPERFLTAMRRRCFGFIFQQFNLLKGISVLENVMLPAYPNGENYGALRERAMGLLAMFNLGAKAEARVEWLSGGEAQRVAIARALVNNPGVIIADEPTAHLDSRLSREFMAYMQSFKAAGKTVIIASHDPLVYESPAVDRIVDMRDGRLIAPGAAA